MEEAWDRLVSARRWQGTPGVRGIGRRTGNEGGPLNRLEYGGKEKQSELKEREIGELVGEMEAGGMDIQLVGEKDEGMEGG